MARSTREQLELLVKAPAKVKAALLVGVLAVVGAAYYFVFYSDLAEQRETLAVQRNQLADEEKSLQKRKTEYQRLLADKLRLERELAANLVKLPASSELPAFFSHLQNQAVAAGVHVVSFQRQSELPVSSFVKVPVKMQVVGDFYQLLDYFFLLSTAQRIITVEDVTLGNRKTVGDTMTLTASFNASTFRQADQPPQKVAEAPKPGTPGAKGTGTAASSDAGKAPGAAAPAGAAGSGGGAGGAGSAGAPGATPPAGAPPSSPAAGAPPAGGR